MVERQVEEELDMVERQVEEELDMGISPKNNSKKDVLRQYFIECLKPIICVLKPIICVGKLNQKTKLDMGISPIMKCLKPIICVGIVWESFIELIIRFII